jgi:hypothetical protein
MTVVDDTIILSPPNTQPITELYAFISVDEHGEGIVSAVIGNIALPLVSGDLHMIEQMRPHARRCAEVKRIELVKFTARETIEQIS